MATRTRRKSRHQANDSKRRCQTRLLFETLEPRTLLDASGPRILGHTPGVQNAAFVHVDVTFNEQQQEPTYRARGILTSIP